MTLEQLIYFSEVYHLKSINAAAVNLNISQPGLSRAITQLEKEFSSIFFVRSKKGVTATPAGERFHFRAQNILHEYALLKGELMADNNFSSCTIGIFTPLVENLATPLFQHLTERFPDTFFDMTTITLKELLDPSNIQYPDIVLPWFNFSADEQVDLIQKIYQRKALSSLSVDSYIWCNQNSIIAKYSHITAQQLAATPILFLDGKTNCESTSLYFSRYNNLTLTHSYTAKTEEIFYSLLKRKNYIALEICIGKRPRIYPELLNDTDFTLKPLSKEFKSTSLSILYKEEFEPFYFAIAEFLTSSSLFHIETNAE